MASYTNLASLAGLQVGDVITYNTATTIDFKKYKVRITLNGIGYNSSVGKGGVAQLDLDTKNLPSQTLTYTPLYGTSLCYGSSADAYYRIAVAGNCGGSSKGGKGGGTQGGSGSKSSYDNSNYVSGGSGGTQTSGGSRGSKYGSIGYLSGGSGTSGSFGQHPSGSNSTANKYYMAGWYSGGTGANMRHTISGTSYIAGNGGGSGFVVGNSTTTYPSGYMGSNNTLINTIVSNISNYSLTQAGSDAYYTSDANLPSTGYMTITILEVPKSFPKYYNSSAWKDTEWKYFDGSAWEDIELKYFNGSTWKDVG